MKDKPKTYYLYAGYYELWISPKKLGAPLVLISSHRTQKKAQRAAERYDDWAHIIWDADLADDVEPFAELADMKDMQYNQPIELERYS